MSPTQTGYALLLILLVLVLGSTAVFLGTRDPGADERSREGVVAADRLRMATEAVAAYAAFGDMSDAAVPGALPCPDYFDPGDTQAGSSSVCSDQDEIEEGDPVYLKRFPWRKFETSRDLSRLWYAIDRDFLDEEAEPLNTGTTGSLTINEEGEYAAVVIESDARLAAENSDGDPEFVDCTGDSDCDDRVRGISSDRIFELVRHRVLAAVRQGLDKFFGEHDDHYPWAAQLGDSNGKCVVGNTSGTLPFSPDDLDDPDETCDTLAPHVADWVQANEWNKQMYYAVACDHTPDPEGCVTPAPDLLTFEGESGNAVVLGHAGEEIVSTSKGAMQDREVSDHVREYLDSHENTDEDGEFNDPENGEGENDQMYAIPAP